VRDGIGIKAERFDDAYGSVGEDRVSGVVQVR
jgi:hypothetical protein